MYLFQVEVLLVHGSQLAESGALIYAAQRDKAENVGYLLARDVDNNDIAPLSPIKD